jgi:hypothetical protein
LLLQPRRVFLLGAILRRALLRLQLGRLLLDDRNLPIEVLLVLRRTLLLFLNALLLFCGRDTRWHSLLFRSGTLWVRHGAAAERQEQQRHAEGSGSFHRCLRGMFRANR